MPEGGSTVAAGGLIKPIQRRAAEYWFLDGALIALMVALSVSIGLPHWMTAYDDAFITYRQAYNLATGQGFVYNVGDWHLVTTTPLYGLLLAILALPAPESIPWLSGLCNIGALVATGLALYWLGRQAGERLAGLLAALLFVASPLLPWTFGGEMLLLVALVLWAMVAYGAGRRFVATVLLSLAVMTRLDALLAVAVIGLAELVRYRRLAWREGLLLGALLAPGLLAGWRWYGTPVPGTLAAKQAQGASGLWPLFGPGLVEWLRAFSIKDGSMLFSNLPVAPGMLYVIPLVAFGLLALPWVRYGWLPLAWVSSFALAYQLLGVPFYHWYLVPLVAGLALLAASGVAGTLRLVGLLTSRLMGPRWSRRCLAVALVGWLLLLGPMIWAQARFGAGLAPIFYSAEYDEAGRWLAINTPATASVGYLEIGVIGYHSHRTIIDPAGLANRDLARHIVYRDLTWAYRHYRPDYILNKELFFPQYIGRKLASEWWFQREYHEVARFGAVGQPPLVLYRRDPARWLAAQDLRPVAGQPQVQLDPIRAGEARDRPTVRRGERLRLTGWALAADTNNPAAALLAVVNNSEVIEPYYGIRRTNIAGMRGPVNAGFELNVRTDGLSIGRHSLRLWVIRADLESYTEAPLQLEFEVTP